MVDFNINSGESFYFGMEPPAPQLNGGLSFASNNLNEADFAHLPALPAGFGAAEFTYVVICTLDPAPPYADVSDTNSAAGRSSWASNDDARYGSDSWWFYGNFLLDGHNNNTRQNGTFSLQIYGSGRPRWTFGDGAPAAANTGDLWGIQPTPTNSMPSLRDGNRHVLACVRRWTDQAGPQQDQDGADLELWANGALANTQTSLSRVNMATTYWNGWQGYPANQTGWRLGCEHQHAIGLLPAWPDHKGGFIAHAFYNAALTPAEIAALTTDSINTGHAAYLDHWEFEEGSGSVANSAVNNSPINLSASPAPGWITL